MRHIGLIFAVCLSLMTGPIAAQGVTLTSHDGTMVIDGKLRGYDGEYFQIDSSYGVLTVDAGGITCEGPDCPDDDHFVARLRVTGARGPGHVLMPALLAAFAEAQGHQVNRVVYTDDIFEVHILDTLGRELAVFSFDLSTSEDGFAALADHGADLILATREVTAPEADIIAQAGQGDLQVARRSRLLALDAMVALAAPESAINSISADTLQAVMEGTLTNWSDLGGPDHDIHLLLPPADTGLGQILLRLTGIDTYPDDARVLNDPGALADAVQHDPFALGVTRFSDRGSARTIGLTGTCGTTLFPRAQSIRTEDFPLAAPLFLYTPARRLPAIGRAFLRFLDGPEAQLIVRQAGFTDQSIKRIPVAHQGARLAHAILRAGPETTLADLQLMTAEMQRSTRLSLTFRFQPGATDLDAQSRANVRRLAELLRAGQFDGQQLLFAGFSDGEGDAGTNRDIALRRAETVLEAVQETAALGPESSTVLRAEGFGEALPIACDDSEWGRQANRRVELWVHTP